jgi:hypothetical protein
MTMDIVQNSDSYINIPLSQTYSCYTFALKTEATGNEGGKMNTSSL